METARRIGGQTDFTVMDTYDFQPGVEPPGRAMKIPAGFARAVRILRPGQPPPQH